MTLAVYAIGGWATTVIAFACYVADKKATHAYGFVANAIVMVAITAAWPLVWLVILGLAIRPHMLAARDAVVEKWKARRMRA